VSNEGRAQRFFQVFPPADDIQESWRWIMQCMCDTGSKEALAWQNLDDVLSVLSAELPGMARAVLAAPHAPSRSTYRRVPREPHRYSGRTAIYANKSVSEPKPPVDEDAPLSFTMEGWPAAPPPALIPFFWAPGWNSIQSTQKFQREVNGPLRGGDPGVRLIEPEAKIQAPYFSRIPEPFQTRRGQWLVVPLYHIFGSEELSASSPPVAQMTPKPYLALNAADSAELQVGEGSMVELLLAGLAIRIPVLIRPELPKGVAGLPTGLPGLSGVQLPAWSGVKRV
jgi:NADH-quinone oxidoreductase subunit G